MGVASGAVCIAGLAAAERLTHTVREGRNLNQRLTHSRGHQRGQRRNVRGRIRNVRGDVVNLLQLLIGGHHSAGHLFNEGAGALVQRTNRHDKLIKHLSQANNG